MKTHIDKVNVIFSENSLKDVPKKYLNASSYLKWSYY